MDFLKAEIARKKKQLEESSVLVPSKNYFKRKDLAAKHEEEYWKKHKRLKKFDDSESEGDASTSAKNVSDDQSDGPEEIDLPPRKEVIKKLRDRGEPIQLYAESDTDSYLRLKKLELEQPDVTRGYKNDFKAAMDQVDEDYLNEILKSTGGDPEKAKSADVKVKDTGLTLAEILEKAKGLGQGDAVLDCDVILNFLKLILKKWGESLNAREEEQKRSFKGKMDSATHTQTVTYIKPLFRKLKKKLVGPDILGCLVDITKFLLDRHYIKANDAYLEMAIGNAPWPIGVTMVGIHARTGREKISARNVAHVLNDETQRKYIQALKRLITYCQKCFPTDPSRSVDFESLH